MRLEVTTEVVEIPYNNLIAMKAWESDVQVAAGQQVAAQVFTFSERLGAS